jgi:hypothetical protein
MILILRFTRGHTKYDRAPFQNFSSDGFGWNVVRALQNDIPKVSERLGTPMNERLTQKPDASTLKMASKRSPVFHISELRDNTGNSCVTPSKIWRNGA